MVIDLSTCIGCNTCALACQAENTIPAVGASEVRAGRDMHWIRAAYTPKAGFVPVACQHCEAAPCEAVCPASANAHAPDGRADTSYARCTGARYCLASCPFEARRFNYYEYTEGCPELLALQRNPDVTVRHRGVVEKCTYCAQRLARARRTAAQAESAAEAERALAGVQPACAQACPTASIAFGDLSDPNSEVSRLRQSGRALVLLPGRQLDPRTRYLARVLNPNPALEEIS